MSKLYLITGATGHVGTILINELISKKENIRALVIDGQEKDLPSEVEAITGDITDRDSLKAFFDTSGYDQVTLIHLAAMVSIASKNSPTLYEVNVNGTQNVMEMALEASVDRVIYISSVHAIPEKPKGNVITEVSSFNPNSVHGDYAKTKAMAAQIALDYAKRGLNVSVIHPSGVIGPGDRYHKNHMIRTIRAIQSGLISMGIKGGYDFVDSRDVVKGILECEENGKAGECYILNGHYVSILDIVNMIRRNAGKRLTRLELPLSLAKAFAPVAEKLTLFFSRKTPILTPYSVYTLQANSAFSHEKAYRDFGYHPRCISETIIASL